ncbi:helix-turn-helix transcriptional regulator [uncultured Amphritea sp.]|uniref:helix-turn-helix domain-containing protein n=1 Tax=uncultured Amphritea sp. TaxID=981605 RepID=UPI0025D9AADB|nr:helix-turn-helix transcriptional regulator [uncultured Amphritea sp.]
MHQDFASNLRLLCSYYKSIAEVCRRLDINRPQFNRYLSGRYKPSAHTLLRFCDFFGVEEHEILMPHEQFERLIKVRPRPVVVNESAHQESEHLARLQRAGISSLEKYLGHYFEYYESMAYPGRILRTLICIERQDDRVYYQRTERLREHPGDNVFHGVYQGIVNYLTDRIFMLDYETLTGNEMTQTILFPSFKNRVSRLSGLKLGVSGSGERMPCCTRVVYEYLGRTVDKQRALSLCGLYEQNSAEIDSSIKAAISNTMDENDRHFRALYI